MGASPRTAFPRVRARSHAVQRSGLFYASAFITEDAKSANEPLHIPQVSIAHLAQLAAHPELPTHGGPFSVPERREQHPCADSPQLGRHPRTNHTGSSKTGATCHRADPRGRTRTEASRAGSRKGLPGFHHASATELCNYGTCRSGDMLLGAAGMLRAGSETGESRCGTKTTRSEFKFVPRNLTPAARAVPPRHARHHPRWSAERARTLARRTRVAQRHAVPAS